MKDKWMNVGYETDELKPHLEPVEDYNDSERIGESSPQLCLKIWWEKTQIATVGHKLF